MICSLVWSISFSQTLERKGSLGARIEPADGGVRVVEVLPGGTAEALRLKAGDVLVEVNGATVTSVPELVGRIATWRRNDRLETVVMRSGRRVSAKGRVVGRPLETSMYGTVIHGEVPFDGGALRSILVLPNGVTSPPVVMWVPGVGCYSQDLAGNSPSPFTRLVDDMVAAGVAVFRVEKPGMGDSRTTIPCEEMDFDHEVEAYRAALKHLHTIPGIDRERIYLNGQSMGVLSAPLVAEAAPVAGIIAWGGLSTTWFEYELKLIRQQQMHHGKDLVTIETEMLAKLPLLADFYIRQQSPEQLAMKPEYADVLPDYFNGKLWHGLMHYSFFQGLGRLRVLEAYRQLDCPVLALAGEFDLHTVDTTWAGEIAAAVNAERPGTAESQVLKGTTHHYFKVPSMEAYVRLMDDHALDDAYMIDNYDPAVVQAMLAWMRKQG